MWISVILPLLLFVNLLTIRKAGLSLRRSKLQFPAMWVTAISLPLISLVIVVSLVVAHGGLSNMPLSYRRPTLFFGCCALVMWGMFAMFPVVLRLNGYRPTIIRVLLSDAGRSAPEMIVNRIKEHLTASGFILRPPDRWKSCLCATRVVEKVLFLIRVEEIVLLRILKEEKAKEIVILVDNVYPFMLKRAISDKVGKIAVDLVENVTMNDTQDLVSKCSVKRCSDPFLFFWT